MYEDLFIDGATIGRYRAAQHPEICRTRRAREPWPVRRRRRKARNHVLKRQSCGLAALPDRGRAIQPAGGWAGTAETEAGNRGIKRFSGRH